MIVYLKKKFKQFNAGSDVVVTFEEGEEMIKKGVATLNPEVVEPEIEEKEIKIKKPKKK